MDKLYFHEILDVLGQQKTYEDFLVTGISTDTRTMRQGDLFIAINGENFKGAKFVPTAIEKGAKAVITDEPTQADIPLVVVPDTTQAYQKIAGYYRDKYDIPLIAITGSNGKTTTRNMVKTILATKYNVYTTEKNYNNEIGLPYTLLRMDHTYDCAVIELGMNHMGEIDRLTRLAKPTISVITNIGMAHIGFLGSQENIKKAKLEIVNGMTNGTLILNGDDPYLKDVTYDNLEVLFTGTNANADFMLKDIVFNPGNTTFTVIHDGSEAQCSLPTIGKHNVYNATEAIAVACTMGFTLFEACAALSSYQNVALRNEVKDINGVTIIKDYYNASPDSMREALNALGNIKTTGNKYGLLGQMHELGDYSKQAHKMVAGFCENNHLSYVFFIGDEYEAFQAGLSTISCHCYKADQREQMKTDLQTFAKQLVPGDVILVKGSRASAMEDFDEVLESTIA